MVRAVIFDLDGTLVETEDLKAVAYGNIIRRLQGEEFSEQDFMVLYRRQIGQTDESSARVLVRGLGLAEVCLGFRARYKVAEPWQVFNAMRVEEYRKFITDSQLVGEYRRPDVIDFLDRMRSTGRFTALATSSLTEEARQVLTIAASMAPVPEEVKIYRSFCVMNTCFRFSVHCSISSRNSGPRWLIIGLDIASTM